MASGPTSSGLTTDMSFCPLTKTGGEPRPPEENVTALSAVAVVVRVPVIVMLDGVTVAQARKSVDVLEPRLDEIAPREAQKGLRRGIVRVRLELADGRRADVGSIDLHAHRIVDVGKVDRHLRRGEVARRADVEAAQMRAAAIPAEEGVVLLAGIELAVGIAVRVDRRGHRMGGLHRQPCQRTRE